jgi:hypothetical protein
MQASASGSTVTSGMAPPVAMTSAQGVTPAGASARTATSLVRATVSGRSRMRARRSASANTALGAESFSANSISSVTHQAFMPTAATPMDTQAQ